MQHSDKDAPESCPSSLESLFDLSPDLLCLASVDGYFKWVNPAFERTLGYTAEEFVSRPMIDFVHPEDVRAHSGGVGGDGQGGELRQFENRYICRDGSIAGCSGTAGHGRNRTASLLRPRGTSPTV